MRALVINFKGRIGEQNRVSIARRHRRADATGSTASSPSEPSHVQTLRPVGLSPVALAENQTPRSRCSLNFARAEPTPEISARSDPELMPTVARRAFLSRPSFLSLHENCIRQLRKGLHALRARRLGEEIADTTTSKDGALGPAVASALGVRRGAVASSTAKPPPCAASRARHGERTPCVLLGRRGGSCARATVRLSSGAPCERQRP